MGAGDSFPTVQSFEAWRMSAGHTVAPTQPQGSGVTSAAWTRPGLPVSSVSHPALGSFYRFLLLLLFLSNSSESRIGKKRDGKNSGLLLSDRLDVYWREEPKINV